jgi:AraC-like DNA-binding protein
VTYDQLDTDAIEPCDRFEFWRDWCARAVDVPMALELVGRPPSDFKASALALTVGTVDVVEYRTAASAGSWTREATADANRLRLMLQAPTRGGHGSIHGHDISLGSGAAVLVGSTDGGWFNCDGLHGIQVNVPREAVGVSDAQLAALNDQRRLLRDPVFNAIVRPAMFGLRGQLGAVAGADVSELPALWISMVTMLVRSLSGRDTNGTDTALARRLQVRRHIQTNLADPSLSPGTIADALYLSRSALYTALPPQSDGLAAEIRRQRLSRAYAILIDSTNTQSIAEVARSVGMPGGAHFSRAFRQHYGLSPRQLRADHRTISRSK